MRHRGEERVMAVESTEPEDTESDDELKWFARDYLRRCQSKEYRRLRREGLLENYLQERADSARRFAETLMRQGTFAPQAWHWAIRARMLNVDMDQGERMLAREGRTILRIREEDNRGRLGGAVQPRRSE